MLEGMQPPMRVRVLDVLFPLSYLACLAWVSPLFYVVQLWSWGTPWALYWKGSPPAQTTSTYQGTLHVLLAVVFPSALFC
jgi:hypothetical protein